jgi:hypothetical protein
VDHGGKNLSCCTLCYRGKIKLFKPLSHCSLEAFLVCKMKRRLALTGFGIDITSKKRGQQLLLTFTPFVPDEKGQPTKQNHAHRYKRYGKQGMFAYPPPGLIRVKLLQACACWHDSHY